MNHISKSIFGLTKSNNGFFKSEKQGKFLIDQMTAVDGCFAHANSGYHSCPIFAKWIVHVNVRNKIYPFTKLIIKP